MSASEHTPSPTSSSGSVAETTSSEGFPPIDFDNDGEWNHHKQMGPAIHTPGAVKDIVVNSYRIEWLNLSEPENEFYAKNHMVGVKKKVTEIAGGWMPGVHYNPGVYTVMLLSYALPAHRAVHHRTYPVREGTTIGHLINKILEKRMHHFLFLLYTAPGGRWKGCGDHVLHCWAHFIREGDITSENSIEDAAMPLSDELVYTYLKGGNKTREPIGRGWWVSYNPLEDHLTPETNFSDRRLNHQLPDL